MFPTSLYAELTPNPNTMKFVADRVIFKSNYPVEYKSAGEAKDSSALATALFDFPFVTGVFVATTFVTITKSPNLNWDLITFELREFIREFLLKNEFAIEKLPLITPSETAAVEEKPKRKILPSEFDQAIVEILDEFIKPAVESDGGAIDFVSFENGTVTVLLRGSCSGCPSSTVTLKDGIEKILSEQIPEVKQVVAESV